MMKLKRIGLGMLALLPTALSSAHAAQASDLSVDLWELPLDQLIQVQVASVATGSLTPVSRSASAVTVITRKQILAMGATGVDEVLETVPGLHITRATTGYYPKYVFRGITSSFNPEALMMINGVPMKRLYTGSRSHIWGGMPVKAIKRIEVLRGPGSALYGADAFSGVINIITLDSPDMTESQAGVRAGSFETWGGWVQSHADLGEATLGLTLEYEDTNGHREPVYADQQTAFDELTGTQASNAPGHVDTGWRGADLRLDVSSQHWQWRLGHQWRDNQGSGVGVFQALDRIGLYRSDRFTTDLTYRNDQLHTHWEHEAQLSYAYSTQENTRPLGILPPGANLGAGEFEDGMLGTPGYREEQARLDLKTAYTALDHHLIRLGTGFFWGDLYEVTESKNFNGFSPLPELVDVSDTPDAFLQEAQRTAYYLLVQDEWEMGHDTVLSTGVRYDDYSDFGDHLTPRIALVHAWQPSLSTRLSYGEAFHAPSFSDLYVTNNPVALGNPDLQPETLKNWEASLTHQPTPRLQYTLTLFHYRIVDAIVFVNNQAENAGRREGEGGELETQWQPNPQWNLVANYSYQQFTDDETGEPIGQAPTHKAYLRLTWDPNARWQTTAEVLWVGKQPRSPGDIRPDLQDYTTLNLSLRRPQLWRSLDLSLAARNLFDANVREPSPDAVVWDDYPQAGRSLMAEATWRW